MMTSSVADDLERRLDNWARWYHGGSDGRLRASSIYAIAASSRRYSGPPMPIINGEAVATDTAIWQLDGPLDTSDDRPEDVMLRRPLAVVLRARYLRIAPAGYEMRTLSEVQVASACYLSYPTYMRRLDEARSALLAMMCVAPMPRFAKIEA